MIRVTTDTNILVSGFQFHGNERKLLYLAVDEKIIFVLSPQIVDEFERVLIKKFSYSLDEASDAVEFIYEICELIEPESKLEAVKDDPTDNKILECAYDGEVEFIVSGDDHLLELEAFEGIPIVRTKRMLELINESKK